MEKDPEQHWLFHQNLPSSTAHGTLHEDSTWSGCYESQVNHQNLQLQALQFMQHLHFQLRNGLWNQETSGNVTNAPKVTGCLASQKKYPKKWGASSFSISACSRSRPFKKKHEQNAGFLLFGLPTGNAQSDELCLAFKLRCQLSFKVLTRAPWTGHVRFQQVSGLAWRFHKSAQNSGFF